eukprot:GHVL01037409.1.p1 GENE.GHVL01037409.1~~GHVL01037409.1.p1  ORF type:complete len:251 (+),score=66.04 GHVL01037409.1:50-754(+)
MDMRIENKKKKNEEEKNMNISLENEKIELEKKKEEMSKLDIDEARRLIEIKTPQNLIIEGFECLISLLDFNEFRKIVENLGDLIERISANPSLVPNRVLRCGNEQLQKDLLKYPGIPHVLLGYGFKLTLRNGVGDLGTEVMSRFTKDDKFFYMTEPSLSPHADWQKWSNNLINYRTNLRALGGYLRELASNKLMSGSLPACSTVKMGTIKSFLLRFFLYIFIYYFIFFCYWDQR